MSDYIRCPHGLFLKGCCFHCEFEPQHRVLSWIERHDRHITVAIGLPTLLACLWVAGQGAIHIL